MSLVIEYISYAYFLKQRELLKVILLNNINRL